MRRRAYAVACRARALLSGGGGGEKGADSRNDVRTPTKERRGTRPRVRVRVRASCGTNVRVIVVPPGPPTPAQRGYHRGVNHGYKQQMTPVDVPAHARWPLSVFDDHRRHSPHQSHNVLFSANLIDTRYALIRDRTIRWIRHHLRVGNNRRAIGTIVEMQKAVSVVRKFFCSYSETL